MFFLIIFIKVKIVKTKKKNLKVGDIDQFDGFKNHFPYISIFIYKSTPRDRPRGKKMFTSFIDFLGSNFKATYHIVTYLKI